MDGGIEKYNEHYRTRILVNREVLDLLAQVSRELDNAQEESLLRYNVDGNKDRTSNTTDDGSRLMENMLMSSKELPKSRSWGKMHAIALAENCDGQCIELDLTGIAGGSNLMAVTHGSEQGTYVERNAKPIVRDEKPNSWALKFRSRTTALRTKQQDVISHFQYIHSAKAIQAKWRSFTAQTTPDERAAIRERLDLEKLASTNGLTSNDDCISDEGEPVPEVNWKVSSLWSQDGDIDDSQFSPAPKEETCRAKHFRISSDAISKGYQSSESLPDLTLNLGMKHAVEESDDENDKEEHVALKMDLKLQDEVNKCFGPEFCLAMFLPPTSIKAEQSEGSDASTLGVEDAYADMVFQEDQEASTLQSGLEGWEQPPPSTGHESYASRALLHRQSVTGKQERAVDLAKMEDLVMISSLLPEHGLNFTTEHGMAGEFGDAAFRMTQTGTTTRLTLSGVSLRPGEDGPFKGPSMDLPKWDQKMGELLVNRHADGVLKDESKPNTIARMKTARSSPGAHTYHGSALRATMASTARSLPPPSLMDIGPKTSRGNEDQGGAKVDYMTVNRASSHYQGDATVPPSRPPTPCEFKENLVEVVRFDVEPLMQAMIAKCRRLPLKISKYDMSEHVVETPYSPSCGLSVEESEPCEWSSAAPRRSSSLAPIQVRSLADSLEDHDLFAARRMGSRQSKVQEVQSVQSSHYGSLLKSGSYFQPTLRRPSLPVTHFKYGWEPSQPAPTADVKVGSTLARLAFQEESKRQLGKLPNLPSRLSLDSVMLNMCHTSASSNSSTTHPRGFYSSSSSSSSSLFRTIPLTKTGSNSVDAGNLAIAIPTCTSLPVGGSQNGSPRSKHMLSSIGSYRELTPHASSLSQTLSRRSYCANAGISQVNLESSGSVLPLILNQTLSGKLL